MSPREQDRPDREPDRDARDSDPRDLERVREIEAARAHARAPRATPSAVNGGATCRVPGCNGILRFYPDTLGRIVDSCADCEQRVVTLRSLRALRRTGPTSTPLSTLRGVVARAVRAARGTPPTPPASPAIAHVVHVDGIPVQPFRHRVDRPRAATPRSYTRRDCDACGRTFVPTGGRARYCRGAALASCASAQGRVS